MFARSPPNIEKFWSDFVSIQDPYKKEVFERKYSVGRPIFSCDTFKGKPFEDCEKQDTNYIASDDVEAAVVRYARDNLAMVKVYKSPVRNQKQK